MWDDLMQYNQIIDSDDQLIYSILTEFLNKNKQKIRIEEIKEQFDLSSHKLIKISERIDQLAKKTETFDFIATNKEWCFKTTPIFSLQDVHTEMIKSSVSYKLLMEILNSSFTSLEEFSQKNFMTKRTFYRKINGLTDYLNNYHLKLNLRKYTLLEGDEYFIRYFYHLLDWQMYGVKKKRTQLTSKQINHLNLLLKTHYPFLRNIDRARWIHYFDISLIRIKNGFFLSYLPESIENYNNSCLSLDVFKELFIKPITIFPNKLEQSKREKEIILLYYMLSMMTTYSIEDITYIQSKKHSSIIHTEETISTFIDTIQSMFNIYLDSVETIFLVMNLQVIHSKTLVFATQKKIDIYGIKTSEQDLDLFFTSYYHEVKSQLLNSKLQKQFENLYSKNERLFFQYCMLIREILERKKPFITKIYLQSKFGKLQEEWQKRRVAEILYDNTKVLFVEKETDADLVLLDYVVSMDEINDKFYIWNTTPSAKNWEYIFNYVDQLHKKYLATKKH